MLYITIIILLQDMLEKKIKHLIDSVQTHYKCIQHKTGSPDTVSWFKIAR